jgi:Domain of Unknown Function with PDB structure (DUF3857)/Transglutaminase-like superfamily
MLIVGSSAAAAERYDIIPTPQWVQPSAVPAADDAVEHAGGAEYLLVDRQIRIDKFLYSYYRFATKITDVPGVEDNSQVRISFDPLREKLHLHAVTLKRGSLSIDELRKGQIRILQRENELDDGILDGNLTFHLLLTDVRVGDTVDYSYSIERQEPEWNGRYFGSQSLQWADPVAALRFRIQSRIGAPMFTATHGAQPPKERDEGGWHLIEWSATGIAGVRSERHVPPWFTQRPFAEFTQFRDWTELAETARHLYAAPSKPSKELLEISNRLRNAFHSEADLAVAAMTFVQDEVRYTGIEEGGGAFRPTAPDVVLARRYGDCKDKTLLAVTLLNMLGIDAAPALVSTKWRHMLGARLPSPGAMDHAVVFAKISGKPYWFDATSTGRRGHLANFAQAHFGAGLVIAAGTTQLQSMPRAEPGEPLVVTKQLFDFRAGLSKQTVFSVSTLYRGSEADAMRRRLADKGAIALGKDYLQYYQGRYPSLSGGNPLQVKDDAERNEVSIEENYVINQGFVPKQGVQEFRVNADTFSDQLDAPDSTARKAPLAVDYPFFSTMTITLKMPDDWEVSPEVKKVDSPIFHYESRVGYADKTVTLDYQLKFLDDNVPAAQLPAYIKQVRSADDDTYFRLTYNPRKVEHVERDATSSWLILFGVLAGAFIALRLLVYILSARAFLLGAVQRVEATALREQDATGEEASLLRLLDDTLAKSGFLPQGYIAHDSWIVVERRSQLLRILAHKDLPMRAFVARRAAPEYGSLVHLWFETRLVDGKKLVTTDNPEIRAFTTASSITQSLPHGSAADLLALHQQRVAGTPPESIAGNQSSLEVEANELTAECALLRQRLLLKRWTRRTAAADLDRFTVFGAFRMARIAIVSGGTQRGKRPVKVTDAERALRIQADLVALSVPREAAKIPGNARGLLVLMAGCSVAIFAGMALIWHAYTPALIFAAVAIHETGHALALRYFRRGRDSLFFLPFIGAIREGKELVTDLNSRVAILLAGPLSGLLAALLILWVQLLWPAVHLTWASWVFAFCNLLTLLPFAPADGARLLVALTRPDSKARFLLQVCSVLVLAFLAWALHSAGAGAIALVLSCGLPRQFTAYRLRRDTAAEAGRDPDRVLILRSVLRELTGSRFEKLRAPLRHSRAAILAEEFRGLPAQAGDRKKAIAATVLVIVLALVLAIAARSA